MNEDGDKRNGQSASSEETPFLEMEKERIGVMIDLAPEIYRQRLVIEGYPKRAITNKDIEEYLSLLSSKIDMRQLNEPVTHLSETYGWAGWIHWESSGAHFYAWDTPRLFYCVDINTCKKFDPDTAVAFTKEYFESETIEYKEF